MIYYVIVEYDGESISTVRVFTLKTLALAWGAECKRAGYEWKLYTDHTGVKSK